MGKKQTRQRPVIRINNEYIPREEYRECLSDGCRNAIAVWGKDLFCSRCRNRKGRR